jgi:hypothetical protein
MPSEPQTAAEQEFLAAGRDVELASTPVAEKILRELGIKLATKS